jgi:hypothetical protein
VTEPANAPFAAARDPAPGLMGAWRDIPRLRTGRPGTTAYMRARGEAPAAGARWTEIMGLSPHALCAIVGAEDPAFFQHRGIWWGPLVRRTASAVLRGERVAGVSTISQQLARNLYLHAGRTAARKLGEMLLARRMERVLGKARILELYVNVVEWGPGTWGVQDAAERYFGCTADQLDAFHAVVLASLLPAPRAPLAGKNLERALGSQRRLLHFLYAAGVMTLTEWRQTGERLALLAAALHAGRDAGPVLRELGNRIDQVWPAATPDAGAILRSHCGLRLRMAYTALLDGEAHPSTWMGRLPHRWTGRVGA